LDDLLGTRPDLRKQFQNQFDQMTLNRSIDELDLSGNVIRSRATSVPAGGKMVIAQNEFDNKLT